MGAGSAAQLGEGTRLAGRYQLERKIGEGAFAAVWLAIDHQNSDLPVAIKVFQPTRRSRDPSYLLRFRHEAELLGKLRHDAIARALDVITTEELTAIVLEYVEGRSLRAEMQRRAHAKEHFELAEIGRLMDALLSALGHAHEFGAVHRDVKPANLVVRALLGSASSAITVLDFGVAKLVDLDAHEATTVGRMLGTISYMAPEQARAGRVDARSDLFSAGVVLFELLTLRRLWHRDADDVPVPLAGGASSPPNLIPAIVTQILRGTRPAPSRFRDELPPALDAAVLRALEVEPEKRFRDAAEMRAIVVPLFGVGPRDHATSLVPPRLPAGVSPSAWSNPGRGDEQRVSGPWVGLAAPEDFAAAEPRRVGLLGRELQRFRHRRLLRALRTSPRFRHFVVDERQDSLSMSGPIGSSGSSEVSELRLTLDVGIHGFALHRTAPRDVVRALEALNGQRTTHVVLLSRLPLCFEPGSLLARAEPAAQCLLQAGAAAVTVHGGYVGVIASPVATVDTTTLRNALDAFVEAGDLIGLACGTLLRSEVP